MFSVNQKRKIADAVQKILRDTNHPELPEGEIQFELRVLGKEQWSWADIKNNGAVAVPDVNLWNEQQDTPMPNTPEGMPERELLAEYAHETWSGWMKWMFGKSMNLSNGEVVIPANLVQRWKRQMCTPYANLEEYEKGSDRAEADKILELLPASHVSALEERVERAEALLKWIPVSERLPEREGRYAVIYREGNVIRWYVADYLAYEKRWMNMWTAEVLAWMELPDIPAAFTQEKTT